MFYMMAVSISPAGEILTSDLDAITTSPRHADKTLWMLARPMHVANKSRIVASAS